jgi:hypothetical protein
MKASKNMHTNRKTVAVADIRLDPDLQPRVIMTAAAIEDYSEAMAAGEEFPACLVVDDGTAIWCVDGFHRVKAAMALNRPDIECDVIYGTREEAMWYAAGANQRHGVRRTNADKRRAVALALNAAKDASLREIAEHCGVSHQMIADIKASLGKAEDLAEVVTDRSAGMENEMEASTASGKDAMTETTAAINAVIRQIKVAQQEFTALCGTPAGAAVPAQRISTDLKNAITALKQAMPYKWCPICNGGGCQTCRLTGYVTKQMWDLIPAQQRGA